MRGEIDIIDLEGKPPPFLYIYIESCSYRNSGKKEKSTLVVS